MKRFKTELYNCVGFIQDPKKLKESVKQLYQKYVQDDTVCYIIHMKCKSSLFVKIKSSILYSLFSLNPITLRAHSLGYQIPP